MEKNIIGKLKYRFQKFGFYYLAVKNDCHDKKGNKVKILTDNLKMFNYKYGYYGYLEIPITTRCSLRCKNCSNLIPCYKKPRDYNLDMLKKSIDSFLECINKIVFVRVLGGEPFLSKDLTEILKQLIDSNKVQRIEVVTNGTQVPKDKQLLNVLKNDRVVVCISEYPIVNPAKLIETLDKNGISYRIDKMAFWMDYGNVKKRNKSKKELIKQYSRCNSVCKSLVNGQLHLCPRSSHGTDLGIIKNNEDDYLDLLDDSISLEEKKKRMNKLFKRKYITACDYCDYGTSKCKKVPVSEQLKK